MALGIRAATAAAILSIAAGAGCQEGQARATGGGEAVAGGAPAVEVQAPARAVVRNASDSTNSIVEEAKLRESALSLLERAAYSDSALLRANAIEGLQTSPGRAEPVVRSALYDQNPGVRSVAAMTVGVCRLADLAPMVERLLIDPEPRVRAAAVYALARTGMSPDPTALADMLWHPDRRVRSQAAMVLGEMGNPSAIPMLRAAAKDDTPIDLPQDRLYRLQVTEAICKLGDRSAVHAIHVALYPNNREDFEAAVLAAQILGTLKDQESVQQLINIIETRVDPGQDAGVSADDAPRGRYLYPPELRLASATSLARMGYSDGAYVADEYVDHESALVRVQAAFLYAAARQKSDLGTLAAMMEGDESPVVRVAAAAALLRFLDGEPGA